ncbi:peptidase domain-containing ABC transporter [Paenibacillus sp. SC116]|uniref:peptidase domain-containing ABC transporter n=1 Tax=Paenibacillus sp. SC116 TaxID=2968986 RepID=UPI00215A1673|nr:peptidase domain-containing ABC transporter [Paenibacillus sp. SC116]MCR8842734.1 peptidase domain-containing ABC transporter [Paenibacillus sp. SC116]
MRKKIPFIEQMEHSECGLACLAMVLGYHDYHVTLTELRNQFGSSKKGSSLYHLIEIGKQFHMIGKAYKAEVHQLPELSMPYIVFWEFKHYVVVERMDKKTVTILDPSSSRRSISKEEFQTSYSGYVLTFKPDDTFTSQPKKRRINLLLIHILKQRKLLTYLLLASLLLQGVGLVTPKLTQWLTDQVILKEDSSQWSVIGYSILGLYLFHQLFSLLRGYLIAKLQTSMDISLMSTFISKLFHLNFSFFESRTSGDLIFRANSNIIIRQILSSRVLSIIIDLILVVGYAVIMFSLHWKLALMVLLLCMVVAGTLLLSSHLLRKLSDRHVSAQTKTQSYLTESIYGICDIKVLGAEKKVFEHWRNLFTSQLEVSQKQSVYTSILDTFSSGIQLSTPLILLWVGSAYVLQGTFTLGELLGFSALAVSFMIPIFSIVMTYSQFLVLGSYTQRLQDVMESKSEEQGGRTLDDFKGSIELEDVSFTYDTFGPNNVAAVSLHIKSGEKVAIVGESGSGKSTLAKLILGLYVPTEGRIKFDGISIEELDLNAVRRQIGTILQETRLSHGTVLDNIKLFNDNIFVENTIRAAQLADIHEDILKQPLGYNTMISEGGINFSGGQRQRLLLARALVNQPKLIVLDEATSALDTLSESRVQENLQQLKCTQVIIAHRLSTVVHADRIVVMKEGQIAEMGHHQELLEREGLYYQLYKNQMQSQQAEMAKLHL